MRDVVTSAVRPLLLGYGKVARQTAWRFFAEYSVTSTVLDRRRTFGSYFSLFFSFRSLPCSDSDEFIIMSLERLADEMGDLTLMIVPCTPFYRELVKRNRERLETRFILRSPEKVCNVRPSRPHITT